MTDLFMWEYEGKTEFGYKYEARFLTLMDPYLSKWRNEVTNLRPAKVVDEDCQDESHTFVVRPWASCGLSLHAEDWEQVLNPKVVEPKNFGAIVEAWYEPITNKREKAHFFNNGGDWILRNTLYNFDWSDLINPTIISEGVE